MMMKKKAAPGRRCLTRPGVEEIGIKNTEAPAFNTDIEGRIISVNPDLNASVCVSCVCLLHSHCTWRVRITTYAFFGQARARVRRRSNDREIVLPPPTMLLSMLLPLTVVRGAALFNTHTHVHNSRDVTICTHRWRPSDPLVNKNSRRMNCRLHFLNTNHRGRQSFSPLRPRRPDRSDK